MALSGTFGTNYGSFLRIQGDWTATQDSAANTSTITLRTYWIDRGSSSGVSASSQNSGNSVIAGTSNSFTATAGLQRNQKKLINTQTRTVSHASNGKLSAALSVTFNPQITFSGTYYGTVTASGTADLNDIARESTLANDISWDAGSNETISILRGSTSFNHVTKVYVRNSSGTYVYIKDVPSAASEMYVSTSFSLAEHTQIFSILNGRASADTRMDLLTYSGNTLIGTTSKFGTVTAPAATGTASGYNSYWYTDQTIEAPLAPNHSNFTHTVRFIAGSFTKIVSGVGNLATWSPTAGELSSLHAQMSTTTSLVGSLEIDTFYNGVQVRGTVNRFLVFYVRDANPTFTATLAYADTNSAMTTITGNNQFIVQGRSTVRGTLSAINATGMKGATITKLVFKLAGITVERNYATTTQTVDFGTIDAATNQTLIVEAVDSRGNIAVVSRIVNVLPYSPPTLAFSAGRVNGFEADTVISTSGSFSPLTVAGVVKNAMTLLRYRTRLKGGTWSAFTTISRTGSGNTFLGNNTTVNLNITNTYEIQVDAIDRISTRSTVRTVNQGRPILFIDDRLNSIAFNDFPKDPNTFLLNGRLTFAGNQYISGTEGEVGGAIDMNNGDIVRANGIYFNDISNNSGEGLLFIKTGSSPGSFAHGDYDNFYIRDGKFYLNNIPYFELDSLGVMRMERDKASNGYNNVTYRDTVNHDDPMLFQAAFSSVSMGGSAQGFVDITWGVAYDSTPVTVMAIATDASSLNYNATVYSLSSTGCRVYLRHLESTTTSAVINIRVMALGRKA